MTKKSDIVEGLRSRMPYQVSRPLLKAVGVPRAHGWEKTAERILEDDTVTDEQIAELGGALRAHALTGEKICRFYRLEAESAQFIRGQLAAAEPTGGKMTDAYPGVLSKAALEALDADHRELVAVEDTGDGKAAVFASVREKPVRHEIEASDLPDEMAEYLNGYDYLVAYRVERQQAMDVVWVPDSGDVIDVRVDFPKHTEIERARHAQHRLMSWFGEVVGGDPFHDPINLFPIIRDMYEAETEGRVVELAFGTTTRSLKHEKMRRNQDCLRSETYHVGGKEALATDLDLYRVSIAYSYSFGPDFVSHPEVNLHTTSLVAGNASPQLYDAVIRKTVGFEDYEFVRQRILHFAQSG